MLVPVQAERAWTFASGTHFDVYTTGGDTVARRALEEFDRAHAYFEQALQLAPLTNLRTHLIVFSGRDEFAPYAANANVTAFYQSNLDGDFIVMPTINARTFPAVAHEYAHLIARRTGSHYPLWLDDGLAEYFSTMTPQGARLQVGSAPPERIQSLGFGVRLMPLERLFAVTRDSAEYTTPSRAALFYAESWALTHMLITDERYRDKSRVLFARLAKGEPTALALTTVYGKPVDEVTRDLGRYTLRGLYRASVIDVPVPTATTQASTRPATEFEASVTLASLLASNPAHSDEARTAFRALEGQNANDLRLIESAGLFAVRSGRIDEARPYLEHAIALKTTNARLYVHCAELRHLAAVDVDHSEDQENALVDTALALAPDDVEVRVMAARGMIRQRRAADAVAVLAPVTRVPLEYERIFAETKDLALRLVKIPGLFYPSDLLMGTLDPSPRPVHPIFRSVFGR